MRFIKKVVLFFIVSIQTFCCSCEIYTQAAAEETVIIIDAGHGGEDSGTIGTNGALEKDINLEISRMMRDELVSRGYTAILTRDEDRLLYTEEENIKGIRKMCDLRNRVKIFNSYESAIAVSIHMNAFSAQNCSGLQIYHSDQVGSKSLAECIRDSVKETLQPDNKRPLKKSDDIYLLKNTICPIVLVECGFLSNPEECEKLSEKEYKKRLSFSIVCGIIKYMEELC